MTNNVLGNFSYEFGLKEEIKIYSLPHLFFTLRNGAARKPVWLTDTFSYNELDRDVYSFTIDIGCEVSQKSFHILLFRLKDDDLIYF